MECYHVAGIFCWSRDFEKLKCKILPSCSAQVLSTLPQMSSGLELVCLNIKSNNCLAALSLVHQLVCLFFEIMFFVFVDVIILIVWCSLFIIIIIIEMFVFRTLKTT